MKLNMEFKAELIQVKGQIITKDEKGNIIATEGTTFNYKYNKEGNLEPIENLKDISYKGKLQ